MQRVVICRVRIHIGRAKGRITQALTLFEQSTGRNKIPNLKSGRTVPKAAKQQRGQIVPRLG
jgi:hypothetical protein